MTPTTDLASSVLTSQNILSVGDVVLDEIIQLELGRAVPAALVVTALTNSIVANLQKTNFVLSGISTSSLASDFGVDLSIGVGNYIGGQLGAELARDLGINQNVGAFVGGQLGVLAGDELAATVLSENVTVATLTTSLPATAAAASGDTIVFDPYSAIGTFAGAEVASLIDPATTQDGAIGGQVGAAVGAAIGAILLSEVPVVGTIIGAFIGELIGTVLGKWVGGFPPNPLALDEIQLTASGSFASVGEVSKHLDVYPGIDRTALMLGQQAASTINSVLAAIGGRIANLLAIGTFSFGISGLFDGTSSAVGYVGGDGEAFADPQTALAHGILVMLQSIQIEGGDIYFKRALFADLDAVDLSGLSAEQTTDLLQQVLNDQQVAKVYESYEQNPLLFDAALANAANASLQSVWVDIVARAQLLGLSNAAPSDAYSQAADTAAFFASGQGRVAPSILFGEPLLGGLAFHRNSLNDHTTSLFRSQASTDILPNVSVTC